MKLRPYNPRYTQLGNVYTNQKSILKCTHTSEINLNQINK